MKLDDELRYGFGLYQYSLMMILGFFISGTGPAVLRSLSAAISGVTGYRAILLVGILTLQLTGGIVALAGFFGGLKKVIQDAKE